MARLTIHDVDCRNGFLRVNKGKFAKDRMVPLGRKASDYVREYLQKVRAEWSQSQPGRTRLVAFQQTSARPAPIPNHRSHGQAATPAPPALTRSVTPHVWRHTCATHLVADGANIAYVQRLAGPPLLAHHADLHPHHHCRNQSHPRQGPSPGPQPGRGHAYKPAIGKEGKPLLYRKGQP